ncbi:MAG: Asp-tRNA(Asn)/Glu-tRNA(Gln) amidotransferase subunit GatC [Planctomycetota bacterium]
MSVTVDENLVRHVGMLSRIELSDDEAKVFGEHLAHILHYVDKLQELDTADVEPMAHAIEIHNVLAEDVPGETLANEAALANAPQRDGAFFKVPKVIGDS